MLRILKYSLPTQGCYSIIEASVIKWLDVKTQDDIIRVWALVDTEGEKKKYKILSIGTGWSLGNEINKGYILVFQAL